MDDDKVIWVILTDGYYIKIVYFQGPDFNLNTYRDGDFEHSSDITYRLITRYRRADNPGAATGTTRDTLDTPDYLFKLLCEFLSEKAGLGEFQSLVFAGPENILDQLDSYLSSDLSQLVVAKIPGDFLSLSQDSLQESLKPYLQIDDQDIS